MAASAEAKGKKAIEKTNQVLERLTVEYVPVDSLRPNDYNPNRQSDHDFELLLRSMREDGFTQPIVASRDGVIVDGEHRWRGGQALGYSEVPVVFVDMTPEQMRIATLRHNRARGSEDVDLAAQVLRDLQSLGALDWAQDSLMMDDVEIQRMLEDVTAAEALAADEFSSTWEPTEEEQDEASPYAEAAPQSTESVVTQAPGGGEQMQASTAAAIEAKREQERKMAAAKTEEEREMVRKEAAAFFRLTLMFQGEEAELVKRHLGSNGAQRLVEILQQVDTDAAGE